MRRPITFLVLFTVFVFGGCKPAATSNPGWTPATSSVPVSPPGVQQNPTGPPGNLAVQTSEQVIQKLADYYKSLNSVACEVETTLSGLPAIGASASMASGLTLEKPDRLAIRPLAGNGFELVSNAKESTIALPELKRFAQGPTLGTLEDLATNPGNNLQMVGMGATFAAALMAPDPYQAIMIGVTKTTLVGVEKIDGVSANHVRFEQPGMNWSLWSVADGVPLVLKTSFEMSSAAIPGLALQNVTHTSLFRNWKANPSTADDTFAYKAPDGFEKADDLSGLFGGGVPAEPKSNLLGKPAPNVESQSLDGKPFNLSETYASNIVMLDFWATWCPPCVAELPVLMKLAEEYKQKGVVLHAVNSGEDVATIQKFLTEQKWNLNVVLDEQDRFGQPYGVSGIPQLVLIDRQGIVQQVHVGYSPDIEKTLRKELDELLAGNNLNTDSSATSEKK